MLVILVCNNLLRGSKLNIDIYALIVSESESSKILSGQQLLMMHAQGANPQPNNTCINNNTQLSLGIDHASIYNFEHCRFF